MLANALYVDEPTPFSISSHLLCWNVLIDVIKEYNESKRQDYVQHRLYFPCRVKAHHIEEQPYLNGAIVLLIVRLELYFLEEYLPCENRNPA